jgi:HEPN domain-containing protein
MTKPHEEWFARAEDDLQFAKIGVREGFHSQACFLAQQAIEKTLKGCLVAARKTYPKTHKLVDLASLLGATWLSRFKQEIKLIDEFYIPTRYPDGVPGLLPSRGANDRDAKEAIAAAEQILETALKKVKAKG